MFSPKSFIVSDLTFRSLIPFEFIFEYGVRECPHFILFHVPFQFSQHHLLKCTTIVKKRRREKKKEKKGKEKRKKRGEKALAVEGGA